MKEKEILKSGLNRLRYVMKADVPAEPNPFGEMTAKLLALNAQIRVLHWQTKSFAEHTALGGFYDSLTWNTDKLIESLQGNIGTITMPEKIEQVFYNMDTIESFFGDLLSYGEMVLTDIKNLQPLVAGMDDVKVILDDIQQAASKLVYLLRLS